MTGKSTYTETMGKKICELIANGKNITQISKLKNYPARSTLDKWLVDIPAFSVIYARAREMRGDWRAEQMDATVTELKSKKIDYNTARIAIDNHKWQAGKENPRRYGEKVQHTGPNGNDPIHVVISPVDKLREVLNAKAKRIEQSDDDDS